MGTWDNSNSQYGLLGVWSGAEVGVRGLADVLDGRCRTTGMSARHSGETGRICGRAGGGTLSMTVAGLASLFVTHDYLDAPLLGSAVGREPFSKPLSRGLAWLETGNNCIEKAGFGAVTRCTASSPWGWRRGSSIRGHTTGIASWRHIRPHATGRRLVGRRRRRGGGPSSHHELTETSVLPAVFARGRHPVLMNKVRFDGFWANRARDAANLARFASKELERPLNWQVVPLKGGMDRLDGFAGAVPGQPPGDPAERPGTSTTWRFVEAGGLIFTQADGGSPTFNAFVGELGRKLFPMYEFAELPQDHKIYSAALPPRTKPKWRYIGNGARIFLLHSPEDITSAWQAQAEKARRSASELGVNIFIYAAGKTDLRNRLVSTHLPPPRLHNVHYRIPIARVKYAGASARSRRRSSGFRGGLSIARAMRWTSPRRNSATFAWGTSPWPNDRTAPTRPCPRRSRPFANTSRTAACW